MNTRDSNQENFKDFYDKIISNSFDFGAGNWTIVNPEIKTVLNEYGEYHPMVEDIERFTISQENLEKLKRVTIFADESLNETEVSEKLYSSIDGINFDPRVGYHLNCYAGYVKEGNFRQQGSSGGLATWIFNELLKNNEIDAVIHVKAQKNSDVLFNYGISKSIEEICNDAKTKYYPVEYSEAIQYVADNPGRYAFIGSQSFVMSLRLLQEEFPIYKERIPFFLGLITAHQKSTKYTEAIAWQCGIKTGNLISINYRKKSEDISPNLYVAEIKGYIDGEITTVTKNMRDIIGTSWGQGFFKAKASDYSDDVINETADVSLGDAWLPRYIKDRMGTSIIITRHPKIDELLKRGAERDAIHLEEVSVEDIYKSQEANYRHTIDELRYRLYKCDKKRKWRPIKRVDPSNDISFLRARIQDSREEIATKSHIIYKKAVELDDINYYINEMNKLTRKYVLLYRLLKLEKMIKSKFVRNRK